MSWLDPKAWSAELRQVSEGQSKNRRILQTMVSGPPLTWDLEPECRVLMFYVDSWGPNQVDYGLEVLWDRILQTEVALLQMKELNVLQGPGYIHPYSNPVFLQ